jgi:hypothetical protein
MLNKMSEISSHMNKVIYVLELFVLQLIRLCNETFRSLGRLHSDMCNYYELNYEGNNYKIMKRHL